MQPNRKFLSTIALAVGVAGCGMLAVKGQQQKLDAFCQIGGNVEGERRDAANFVVVLARKSGDSWQVADHFVREGPGAWQFAASAGTYGVVAFQDLNRDLKLQPDEPFLRSADLLSCTAGERRTDLALRIPAAGRSGRADTVDVAALQLRSFDQQLELSLGQVTAVGEIANLSDPRFDQAIAEDGLWRPFDFLFKGHPGIYFLGAYDSTKTPVLFVHGINGSPQNFRTLVERIDRTRFQPWVYYYPSGASLAAVADHLAQTMRKVQAQYGFKSFVVVAHSMGGLVSRGFLQRYRDGGAAAVPLFVSIATPWDGHKGAELGVKTAPAVVRVWIDMAPGSEYLKSIYEKDIGVPHYLMFSFRQGSVALGEANDGTVTVASQLRPAAQQAAARVEGFNETHMGVLESPAVAARLNELLARAR
jgi:pimeloyl-ACP methyl ester carboxylesterase